jgi:hypothetical protein
MGFNLRRNQGHQRAGLQIRPGPGSGRIRPELTAKGASALVRMSVVDGGAADVVLRGQIG